MVVECIPDLKWQSANEAYSGIIRGTILKTTLRSPSVLAVWTFLIGLILTVLTVLEKSPVKTLVARMNSVNILVNGFKLIVIIKTSVKIILPTVCTALSICCIGKIT